MNVPEPYRELLEASKDAVLLLENDRVVNYNSSAAELLNETGLEIHAEFYLHRFSPEFQPDRILSVEMEEESRKTAAETGCLRIEWLMAIPGREKYYAEITFLHREIRGNSWLLVILRTSEKQKEDIIKKNEEIKIQAVKIERQNEQIEIQRDLAEKQRDEIALQKKALIDSIRYASRIQSALLPDHELLGRNFSGFFILNKPRDILSGDFYWFSEIKDKIIIVVADCTGHGVPGALLSVLGMKFLDEIVNSKGIIRPDNILNHLRKRIIGSIGPSGKNEGTSDGMDIAVVSIDKAGHRLHFAGALNPLIIINNGNLREIKGDMLPLGSQTISDKSYKQHEVILEPEDSVYLFTDGYADQFGWRSNKKIKLKYFRDLIISIQNLPVKAQGLLLENNLKNWMGDLEQTDDILVLGLKL